MEESATEGESPVRLANMRIRQLIVESRSLEVERQIGGNFLRKLNTRSSPIAKKYREGTVKSTLKRELKVPETAKREASEAGSSLPRLLPGPRGA